MTRPASRAYAPMGVAMIRAAALAVDEVEPLRSADAVTGVAALKRFWRERPDVRRAVSLAATDLARAADAWAAEPGGEVTPVATSINAYVQRMAGRAIPFGTFSGCATAAVGGERTSLRLDGTAQRHVRLDTGCLELLLASIVERPGSRERLRYRRNDSLVEVGERWQYAVATHTEGVRTYDLVAVGRSAAVDEALAAAREPVLLGDLAKVLAGHGEPDEVEAFVDELVDAQLLLCELVAPVTGDARLDASTALLRDAGLPEAAAELAVLAELLDEAGTDDDALDAAVDVVRRSLGEPDRAASAVVQVDLWFDAADAVVSDDLLALVTEGVDLLRRTGSCATVDDQLATFAAAFTARWEDAEVPLLVALDEEVGIGFERVDSAAAEDLLRGIPLAEPPVARSVGSRRQALLLDHLVRALQAGRQEIALTDEDVVALAVERPEPDGWSALVRLVGDEVCVETVVGPPATQLVGRFLNGSAELRAATIAYATRQAGRRPDAITAEIVHLPQGRVGNVIARPSTYAWELPYLGRSGAPAARRLAADDLVVSVRDGRVVLRSRSLDVEVLPRLSNAHAFDGPGLPVYRFLCVLQSQGSYRALYWGWEQLDEAPFLPRVRRGRIILARARWTLDRADLAELALDPAAFRDSRGLPRRVVLADGDNELPLDLDDGLAVATLVRLARGSERIVLVEGLDDTAVTSPAGRHVAQLVVLAEATDAAAHVPVAPALPAPRRHAPGGDWLSLRLDAAPAACDELLVTAVAPVAEALGAEWFFLRYADPGTHLRVRLRGLCDLAPFHDALRPALDDGRLWDLSVRTYVPEVARYGGPAALAVCERLFAADSRLALAVTRDVLAGTADHADRWRAALVGADRLLRVLGHDAAARQRLARSARDGWTDAYTPPAAHTKAVGRRLRSERAGIDALRAGVGPLADHLARADDEISPLVPELRDAVATTSWDELSASLVHMRINRLLRSLAHLQELVLYRMLDQLALSDLARDGR